MHPSDDKHRGPRIKSHNANLTDTRRNSRTGSNSCIRFYIFAVETEQSVACYHTTADATMCVVVRPAPPIREGSVARRKKHQPAGGVGTRCISGLTPEWNSLNSNSFLVVV